MSLSATIGIAFSANLLTFLIFYELLTLATYPLVVHKESREAIRAGRMYLSYALTAGLVLLVAIVWLQVRAGTVVSDAGARLTFGRLLPESVRRRHRLEERLAALEPSVGHTCLHLGLERTAEELELPHHNLWIFPDHDHDRNIARFREDPEAPLPVTFVSFPSAKDPDFENRYPGRATIEAITLAPWPWFERWEGTRWQHRGDDYEALKARFTERLLGMVTEQLPQVAAHVDHAELSSPLSTRQFAGHPTGEIYGLAHTPERFDARWLKPRTPVAGLYLTGADVSTAGVAGAMFGGAMAASAILGRNLMS